MDGRTKFSRVKKLIDSLEKRKLYHMNEIKKLIMMEIGSQEKTISETLKLMTDFQMIKEIRPFIFKICKDEHL